jgi:short-subunit dehydrogenase
MVRQHSGHIVNTASMAGLVTSASQASYTATALCPGVIRTPILTGGVYGRIDMPGVSSQDILKSWERLRPMAPDKFAERVLRAVLRNDAIIVVPGWWKTWWYLERLSPALSLRLAKSMLKRVRELESTAS